MQTSRRIVMETRELERIRFITRHFNDLQGLRYGVPLGLIALGGGLTLLSPGVPMLLLVAALLGALALRLGAGRYYRSSFGAVERQPIDAATDVYPVSIFSPAGPIPRLALHRQVAPIARTFISTLVLALTVFVYVQTLPDNFVVRGDEALGQHPRIAPEAAPTYAPPWVNPGAYPNGGVIRSESMLRAVSTQTAYLVLGCFFLSLWLWRGRHPSQNHQLALAVLLLGLAAAGTSLGFLARRDGGLAPLLDRVLPALVYPGVALLLCGSALVLSGLLDHRQLARTLGPAAPGLEDRP
jgi:hypothetical protein